MASFSKDSSLVSFIRLFSSSPKPINIYLILGNLGFKFLINIKILSWPFLLSNLETVIIFGKESPKFLSALISEANLFLMPSRIEKKSVEGFGISFIEAASYGVGSIGGKDGGASDAITHNKTGLICDGNDLNSIYDSVVSFFQNENYVKYGKNAQEFSEKFHWDKVVKNYLKLID